MGSNGSQEGVFFKHQKNTPKKQKKKPIFENYNFGCFFPEAKIRQKTACVGGVFSCRKLKKTPIFEKKYFSCKIFFYKKTPKKNTNFWKSRKKAQKTPKKNTFLTTIVPKLKSQKSMRGMGSWFVFNCRWNSLRGKMCSSGTYPYRYIDQLMKF